MGFFFALSDKFFFYIRNSFIILQKNRKERNVPQERRGRRGHYAEFEWAAVHPLIDP